MLQYINEIQNLGGPGQVTSNCNEIAFYSPQTNTGTMTINNIPIAPGCIFSMTGHPGEMDISIYDYNVLSPGAGDVYFVVRKFYHIVPKTTK